MRFKDLGLEEKLEWTNAFAVGYAMFWKNSRSEAQAEENFKTDIVSGLMILRETCHDLSDELVTVTLLGDEGIEEMLKAEQNSREVFGDAAVDLMKELQDVMEKGSSHKMQESSLDIQRFSMVQMVVALETYVIPQLKKGEMSSNAVKVLTDYTEKTFADVKSASPKLGERLDANLKEAKSYLTDKATLKPNTPKPPKF